MKSLGSAIQELVEHLGIGKKVREYDAVLQWETVVGEKIASVSTATRIQQGVLIVKVKNAPWRNELTLRKTDIIQRLNEALHETVVKDIRFQ